MAWTSKPAKPACLATTADWTMRSIFVLIWSTVSSGENWSVVPQTGSTEGAGSMG